MRLRRTVVLAVLVPALLAVTLVVSACAGEETTTTTQVMTTTAQPTTTTAMDARARYMAAATPISWDELMAGAPTRKVLKVTGTIGEGGVGTGGGGIDVGGDPDHILFFFAMPGVEGMGLPSISMDDFHIGEATLYGTASGEEGLRNDSGPDIVMMFEVAIVEYGKSTGSPPTSEPSELSEPQEGDRRVADMGPVTTHAELDDTAPGGLRITGETATVTFEDGSTAEISNLDVLRNNVYSPDWIMVSTRGSRVLVEFRNGEWVPIALR